MSVNQQPRRPWVLIALLLVLGIQLTLLVDHDLVRPWWELLTLVLVCAVPLVPPVARWLRGPGDRIAQWLRRWRWVTAGVISVGGAVCVVALLWHQEITIAPIFQDEFSYLLQARMLADGHLWMPRHPLAEFFDTFYVITDRAYASQYFPGNAMLLAMALWLGVPVWWMPLLATGLTAGLMFLLVLEWLDDALLAVTAAIGLLGISYLRGLSTMLLAQTPTMCAALAVLFLLARWWSSRGLRYVILMSVVSGWLVLLRPVDALIVAGLAWLAVAGKVMTDAKAATIDDSRLTIVSRRRETVRRLFQTFAPLAIVASVVLLLQCFINHGVSGSWRLTPFSYYQQRDMPGTALGFADARRIREQGIPEIASEVPQKIEFYNQFVWPLVEAHSPASSYGAWVDWRLGDLMRDVLPDPLWMLFLPLGLWASATARTSPLKLLWRVGALFLLVYGAYVFPMPHYVTLLMPVVIIICLSGIAALASKAPTSRVSLALLLIAAAVCSLPLFERDLLDRFQRNELARFIESLESTLQPTERGIVLIRYTGLQNPQEEAVYNSDVSWPDDARLIRAHDRGDDNRRLFDYYNRIGQGDRRVIRVDRSNAMVEELGSVRQLAGD